MHLVPLALFGDGDTDLGQISKKIRPCKVVLPMLDERYAYV